MRVKHPAVPGNDLGYVIINDADFDPSKHEPYGGDAPPAAPESSEDSKPPLPLLDVMAMTTPELRAELDKRGIKYHANAKKPELQMLLSGSV